MLNDESCYAIHHVLRCAVAGWSAYYQGGTRLPITSSVLCSIRTYCWCPSRTAGHWGGDWNQTECKQNDQKAFKLPSAFLGQRKTEAPFSEVHVCKPVETVALHRYEHSPHSHSSTQKNVYRTTLSEGRSMQPNVSHQAPVHNMRNSTSTFDHVPYYLEERSVPGLHLICIYDVSYFPLFLFCCVQYHMVLYHLIDLLGPEARSNTFVYHSMYIISAVIYHIIDIACNAVFGGCIIAMLYSLMWYVVSSSKTLQYRPSQ